MTAAGNEEIGQLILLAGKFATRELDPGTPANDRYPFIPFDGSLLHKAANLGFTKLTVPESAGGPGFGMRPLAEVLRIIAQKDAALAVIIFTQCIAREVIITGASRDLPESLKKEVLDDSLLFALPLYSDPEEPPIFTGASAPAGGFHLDGTGFSIPCLPVSRKAVVPASVGNRTAIFLIERDKDGAAAGDPVIGLGLRGCPMADLTLDHVHASDADVLTRAGPLSFAAIADRYRGPLAAIALGVMEGAYEGASGFAKTRYQAKKQIIEHDMIRRMLAQMLMRMDAARICIQQLCREADGGNLDSRKSVSVLELVMQQAAKSTTDGVQILGGYGYMREYGQERRMRDAKQLQALFGGSPSRMNHVIEKGLSQR